MRRTLLVCALAVGCGFPEHEFEIPDIPRPVGSPSRDVNVSGVWDLSGFGTREGCKVAWMNADTLVLRAEYLSVVQEESGELVLEDEFEGFEMRSGRVSRSNVMFETVEMKDGEVLRYSFDGDVDEQRILGTFGGSGPGTCETTGEFQVKITVVQ